MGKLNRIFSKYSMFGVPILILIVLILGFVFEFFYKKDSLAQIFFIIGIIPGAFQILVESFIAIKNKTFALDYIAILAIFVAIISKEYLVGGVIALMISSGNSLEKYAQKKAKSSLTALSNRIPNKALVWESKTKTRIEKVTLVKKGEKILVRKGEIIPLDGLLISDYAQLDESSLTGESYFVDKIKGDKIRSGTINLGSSIIIKVEKEDKDSTYRQIINMVEEAQEEKSPLIKISHKYNVGFTILALFMAFLAYLIWKDFSYVLAVLVIATPCPLLIAAPVALIGGMSSSAKKKIIMKNLSAIETVSKVDTLVFDKTGTITLGKPILKEIEIKDKKYSRKDILRIAEAIERNSLHPFAHSIIHEARKEKIPLTYAEDVHENLGKGISGTIGKKRFTINKGKESSVNHLHLLEGRKIIAEIIFEDILKKNAKEILEKLKKKGMDVHVFTGDKKEVAEKLRESLDEGIKINSEMSPKDKQDGIKNLKKKGKTIAMVGDGINDAPALALSDVGMVFSHEENTASSEAADIVFLGGNFSQVYDSIKISKRTLKIAKQSMIAGITLSVIGMGFAAAGFIVPLVGAILQEVIDASVILNSLRSIRNGK